MQDQLQNSLPLTPRPPIEGEPSGCKQEVADSVVTAGCTNGMVGMTKPPQNDADVNRTALLGGKPAERACGVDEGDGMEHEPQTRLPKAELYREDKHQHNENASKNLPSAYKLPLKGEWTGYASGEARDPEGDANASDTATEHADCPCKSRETVDANGVESEGCREGMSRSASVDKADGNASHGTGPVDTSNELMEFVAVSIEPEDLGSGGIPHVCLGDQADGSEGLTDVSRGLVDGSRESTDPSCESKRAETAMLGCGDGPSMYLGPGDAKHLVNEADGAGIHADRSTGQVDAPSIQTKAIKPAKAMETISIPQKKVKPPDLPIETARGHPDKLNGCGNLADTLSIRTDGHSDGDKTETAVNETESVRKCQNSWTTRNLPITPEIKRSESTRRWRRVSVEDVDIYVPWNAPVEALG